MPALNIWAKGANAPNVPVTLPGDPDEEVDGGCGVILDPVEWLSCGEEELDDEDFGFGADCFTVASDCGVGG